jgi:glycosyltransferase involved in cell wall biosynthesis
LVAAGHEVISYIRDNHEIAQYGWKEKTTLPARTLWAWDSYAEVRKLLDRTKCDVVHFHNTFPLVSPAAYYACRELGVPVVQSLDNPRLFCLGATCLRRDRVCQDCLQKKVPWPGVLHACYRRSHIESLVVAAMLVLHRFLKSWQRLVDCYLVATEFYRRKFVEAGLPAERIVVNPHFVEDHGVRETPGSYALFVGRLAAEKGVNTLLGAWTGLGHIPLMVRGEGPLSHKVHQLARESGGSVQLLQRLDRDELNGLMRGARFLVWPSEGYYETFGYVAAEAFSCGVPVLASRTGVMEEMVADGRTGVHFTPGDPEDFAAKVEWAWTHPKDMAAMGRAARAEYEAKYTPQRNYATLMKTYQRAIDTHTSN